MLSQICERPEEGWRDRASVHAILQAHAPERHRRSPPDRDRNNLPRTPTPKDAGGADWDGNNLPRTTWIRASPQISL